MKQCEAIVRYLALSFWPHPLVLDYGTAVITDPARTRDAIAALETARRLQPAYPEAQRELARLRARTAP